MRTWIQALSLALFSLLFFFFANYKLPEWLPRISTSPGPPLGVDCHPVSQRMDRPGPLVSPPDWATLGVGRFFCGYVCPMGVAIDFLDPLLGRRKARSTLKSEASWRKAKFFLLILFLSSSLAGLTLAYLMDPLPLLTRFYTFVLYPLTYHPNQSFSGPPAPLTQPWDGWGFPTALYSACLLHGAHHFFDLFRDHSLESDRSAFLVPVPLSVGSLPESHLSSWALQAPGESGMQRMP